MKSQRGLGYQRSGRRMQLGEQLGAGSFSGRTQGSMIDRRSCQTRRVAASTTAEESAPEDARRR